MNDRNALNKTVEYGRKLIHAGVSGVEAGENSGLHGQSRSSLLFESTRDALPFAAAGACAGWLGYQLMRRRVHPLKILSCGALAFVAGFGWKTRKVSTSVAHSTFKEVSKVRDEHWLELHPIDYA
jgi:hypothetical protein